MTTALAIGLSKFMAFGMLLIAWPVKRAAQKYLPEGRLKRFLLFSWN